MEPLVVLPMSILSLFAPVITPPLTERLLPTVKLDDVKTGFTSEILPVVLPPIVNVLLRVDWIVAFDALRYNPSWFMVDETDAVGLPVLMPRTPNCAEEVAFEP